MLIYRIILTPRRTKTPPLIDLTLNESEICKDLDIAPKPVKISLRSTPHFSKYRSHNKCGAIYNI